MKNEKDTIMNHSSFVKHSLVIAMKTTFYSFVLLLSSQLWSINPEVLIVTHSYNRPDFIELQDKTLKKFLKDDYEFVVFNDAKTDELENDINTICKKLNIRCIRVPQSIHASTHPSRRHIDCIHYAFREIGAKHEGIFAQFDSDLFLIEELSIKELMKNCDIAANLQNSKGIFWLNPVIALFDMRNLPNIETMRWDCDPVHGIDTDTGGYTYYYLKKNNDIRLKKLNRLFCNYDKQDIITLVQTMGITENDYVLIDESIESLKERGFGIDLINILRDKNVHNFEFYGGKRFLHIGNSSYVYTKDQDYKIGLIKEYLNKIIEA